MRETAENSGKSKFEFCTEIIRIIKNKNWTGKKKEDDYFEVLILTVYIIQFHFLL